MTRNLNHPIKVGPRPSQVLAAFFFLIASIPAGAADDSGPIVLGAPIELASVGTPDLRSVDAAPDSPRDILRRAFANQFNTSLTSDIELVMHNQRGQTHRRRFDAAQKLIDGRVHSLGRLTYPDYLRDMSILQIEEADRSHNAFVYLPSMNRIRRITTYQRGDAFFGTDVTYEDLEKRYVEHYEIVDFQSDHLDGEPVFVIRTRPLRDVAYAEAVFTIARSDDSLLRVDHLKVGADEPYRSLWVHRGSMIKANGHTLHTRITVENRSRKTRTEITYRDLQVDPKISDRLFSVRTLEQRVKIR